MGTPIPNIYDFFNLGIIKKKILLLLKIIVFTYLLKLLKLLHCYYMAGHGYGQRI